MRILLISSGSGSRGGGEIFLHYLSQGLSEAGHEVVLWLPAHPRMDKLAARCSTTAQVIRGDYRNTYDHKTRSLGTIFNAEDAQSLAEAWSALQPDVIHLNKQNLEDGLDMPRALDSCSAPAVCTIHLTQTASYLKARVPWLRDRIAKMCLSRFRGTFVAVQETRRMDLHTFLNGKADTQTIWNGVPRAEANAVEASRSLKRQELGLDDHDFLVLGVGRLVAQKRPLAFLEKAKQIAELMPQAKFVWVGDGNLRHEWDAWIKDAGLEAIISCTGWCEDVASYLAAGDLLLHLAEFEGLPLAILEAMSWGLPCAVTKQFADEIGLFDSNTVLLADRADQLFIELQRPGRLADVANAGKKLAEDKFSIHAMTKSYENLYVSSIAKVGQSQSVLQKRH